jgi:hypothetical protein
VDLTDEIKQKIIGGNIARLYGIDAKQAQGHCQRRDRPAREYAKTAHDTGIAGTSSR